MQHLRLRFFFASLIDSSRCLFASFTRAEAFEIYTLVSFLLSFPYVHLNAVNALSLLIDQIGQIHEHLVELHHRALDVQNGHVRFLHLTDVRFDGGVHITHHGLYYYHFHFDIPFTPSYTSNSLNTLTRLNHLVQFSVGFVQNGLQDTLDTGLHVLIVLHLRGIVFGDGIGELSNGCVYRVLLNS